MGEWPGVRVASKRAIEINFRFGGKLYRERIKAQPTPANLRVAHEFRCEIIEAIRAGTFDYAATFPGSKRAPAVEKPLTCGDVLYMWLSHSTHLKASTRDGYDKIIKFQLLPHFGKIPVTEITRATVKAWIRQHAGSDKTRANVLGPLRAALAWAYREDILDANPLAGLQLQRQRRIKMDPIDPFDAEERAAILEAMNAPGRCLIEFLFWTGLRISEACALDWSDVDWVHGKLRVNKALTQHATEAEAPKTQAGDRMIDLLAPALAALSRQKVFTYLAGGPVFTNPRTGERWTGDAPIRKTLWVYALKRAGVRYRYPYQCRHTFATMMLDAGENIRWISAQLGHADWTFTARTYTRWMPQSFVGAGKLAVERFGKCGC